MPDVIVVGAGPAGLGAALAAARAGASVALVDAASQVGGLCVTRRGPGVAYDLGGHIPFIRNERRLRWLRELLGDALAWVPRPVSCVRDGVVVAGRYLDQRPTGPVEPLEADGSARGELGGRLGGEFVDRVVRPYLEKIDGVPLERIPAERARRLRDDQAAPEGFHYPVQGIGQLMDAMADAADVAGARIRLRTRTTSITTHAGQVTGVVTDGPQGRKIISAPALILAMPAGAAARLVTPAPPPAVVAPIRMRAVCLVYVEAAPASPLDQAWVQVSDPAVPFARAFLPGRWSELLASGNRTVFGMECYCSAEPDDPIWGLSDGVLTHECVRALTGPLGWVDGHAHIEPLEVVRLPRAYPVPDIDQVPQVQAAPLWLSGIEGVQLAPGAAVIEAIENGERAAAEALAGLAG